MGRQGEGGGLKILKIEETSFMDDPLGKCWGLSTSIVAISILYVCKHKNDFNL